MASFGENLRRERELRGVALRDIAEATKIPSRFLQALEEGRVDVLPGGVFRRAFVREYAKFVGLDPDRLVAEFIYAHGDAQPEMPVESRRPFPFGALAVAVVILLGVGLSLIHSSRGSRPTRDGVAAPSMPSAPAPERVYSPKVADAVAESGTPQGLVLTLSARESCWVSVQVDGRDVLNRVMGEGETETLEATGRIVLSVGNAGGLAFRVNDHRGVPLGRSGEVKRNIVITKQNLPSLVEDAPAGRPDHSS
jgi:cytoskeletal protein RodZ